jgi:hypothetical protein
MKFGIDMLLEDRLCGLVVRVLEERHFRHLLASSASLPIASLPFSSHVSTER